MYHERQSRQMCLVHALNCLLQEKRFDSHSLDEICYDLNESKWMNPHRSWIGLGNYDANVLFTALTQCGLESVWFDIRLPIERINFSAVMGMIFNVPSRSIIPFWNGRHWFTVLKTQDGRFKNLDSKFSNPIDIPDIAEFTRSILRAQGDKNQLILVTRGSPSELILP